MGRDVAALGYAPILDLPATRTAPRGVRAAAILFLALAFGQLAYTGWSRLERFDPDFEYFYKAGRWLLDHGGLDQGYDIGPAGEIRERDTLKWYLPFASRAMTVIAWMPPRAAGVAWLAMNLFAAAGTIVLLGRYLSSHPPQDWPVTQVIPFVLTIIFWYWEFRLNQINALTLFLLVLSYVVWEQGRDGLAGFWLGLAILLKVTPGLMLIWFLLKRQYRVAAAALLTVALAGPVSDALFVFGPPQTVNYYKGWFDNALLNGSPRGLILNQVEMDWRNQALGAVLSRWLHPTSYATRFDNDPRMTLRDAEARFNIVDLSETTVATVATAVSMASLALLVWFTRRPAIRLSPIQLRLEWALVLLAMLWLMPVMRRYHLIWMMPTFTVLGGALLFAVQDRGRRFVALAAVGGAALAQLSLLSRATEASGLILLSIGGLVVALVVMHGATGARGSSVGRADPVISVTHKPSGAAGRRDVHA